MVRELYQMFATMILMEYLTETSVSPLQANFVEVDKPLGKHPVKARQMFHRSRA